MLKCILGGYIVLLVVLQNRCRCFALSNNSCGYTLPRFKRLFLDPYVLYKPLAKQFYLLPYSVIVCSIAENFVICKYITLHIWIRKRQFLKIALTVICEILLERFRQKAQSTQKFFLQSI